MSKTLTATEVRFLHDLADAMANADVAAAVRDIAGPRPAAPPTARPLRILVTGYRHWRDTAAIAAALDEQWVRAGCPTDVTVVHGACATGADAIADAYARSRGWKVEPHPADWDGRGAKAGPERNQRMVDLGADVCTAFPTGQSRGTYDCMRKATAAGIPVIDKGQP